MMKKLLLICTAIFAFNSATKAQTVIKDTLRYFTYKQMYKLPAMAPGVAHPAYKSKGAVVSNTLLTHVGSIFKNTHPLQVYGLEAQVLRQVPSFTQDQTNGIPFRLYLCDVVNGTPVFPPIDSISRGIWNNTPNETGARVAGTFTNATPRIVNGDFAVLFRNLSGKDGDTIKLLRTSGHTATSTTAPSPAHKFGEGLGVVRNNGVFRKTTDYNHPQFGVGTDYEFCVAPMITFTLNIDQIQSSIQDGACEWEVFTNTNTSSPELTNKQFNFNEFYRQLKPFSAVMPTSFIPDSVLGWDMGDGQAPYYLPMNWDTIMVAYASGVSNQFFNGFIFGNYKQMCYHTTGNGQTISGTLTFSSSSVWCNDSAGSGIHEMGNLAKLKIYPNPTVDKTTISGLEGDNTVLVYNMMGQLLATETVKSEIYSVDLTKFPQGNYLIRINNTRNNSRIVKLIKE